MFNLFKSRATPPPPDPRQAGPDDIAACFRLLLGRQPPADELALHLPKIGRDLSEVVASFTSSAEFATRGLLIPPQGASDARAQTTTLDDLYFCFRLLLGRSPNPEEWIGHAAQHGEPLDRVVAIYATSREFMERGLSTQSHLSKLRLVDMGDFQIYVAPNDAAVGQHVAGGVYEPNVTAVFRRLLKPGMSVVDIGANIGYFTMLSATLVGASGHVLAIEPNPRNIRMLEASRRINQFAHVTPLQAAAGRETGLLVLNTAYSNGTTSSVSDDVGRLLEAETVGCVVVDAIVAQGRKIDFIKVDVEGAEYNALLGCTKTIAMHRPVILSEFSPGMLSGISGITGPDYLAWLMGIGYRVSVIGADGSTIAAGQNATAIMQDYMADGTDHIDVLATPI